MGADSPCLTSNTAGIQLALRCAALTLAQAANAAIGMATGKAHAAPAAHMQAAHKAASGGRMR